MANPVLIDCPKNTWTKVATNITTGQIHKKTEKPQEYLHTYRQTGEPAPTGVSEGVPIFIGDNVSELISSTFAIDIYIYPIGENGKIRVDL